MMYFFIYQFLLFHFISRIFSNQVAPTVETRLGKIVGTYRVSRNQRPYEAFEGIPYAKQPIGPLRFQPPEPIDKYNEVIQATQMGKTCTRSRVLEGSTQPILRGNEDCLFLNVYGPVHDRSDLLPVLVFFHGGASKIGSGFTGNSFMDKNIIFVSMNFRLGIMGFLSSGDGHISGNMGLKDQSMALKWTSENIRSFGGDPDRITLLGSSSGGSSVHFHYLSPLSIGLFRNGISFSGSALNPGYIDNYPSAKFQKFLDIVKCRETDMSSTVECLRNKPAVDVVTAIEHFIDWKQQPMVPFGPVVEKNSPRPFIDRSPIDIINSGGAADVLWIAGVVKDDGLIPGAELTDEDISLEYMDKNWITLAPKLLMFNMPEAYHTHFSNLIRTHYFGDQKIERRNKKTMIALLGDRLHCSSMRKAAKLQAKMNSNPVLFWHYNYRATVSFSDAFMKVPEDLGVCHADDINMIIDNYFIDPTKDPNDQAVQNKMLDLVLSVAEKGYPDLGEKVKWEKVNSDSDKLEVLHFGNADTIYMMELDSFCNYQFWDGIAEAEKYVTN